MSNQLTKEQKMSETEESKTAQILVRISEEERDEWKAAAEVLEPEIARSNIAHACLAPPAGVDIFPWPSASCIGKCAPRRCLAQRIERGDSR